MSLLDCWLVGPQTYRGETAEQTECLLVGLSQSHILLDGVRNLDRQGHFRPTLHVGLTVPLANTRASITNLCIMC